MPKRDSVDKIVTAYFAAVNSVPFRYKGTLYPVKTLTVSPALLRGYTCPAGCGGCCTVFSLDYLPTEKRPKNDAMHMRFVPIDIEERDGLASTLVDLFTDWQETRTEHHCQELIEENGRCGIHGIHPFSCDFELARFFHSSDSVRLGTQLYGRGWNMLRVDGQRGAQCTITPPTEETKQDILRKLARLVQWCEHFHIPHRVRPIIDWVHTNPTTALVLSANRRIGLFD